MLHKLEFGRFPIVFAPIYNNNQTAEQWNDCTDDHAMTPTGVRPAEAGVMRLVRAQPSPHDCPTEGGPGHQLAGDQSVGCAITPKEAQATLWGGNQWGGAP